MNCEEATRYGRVNAELVLPAWLGNAGAGCGVSEVGKRMSRSRVWKAWDAYVH